MIDELTQEIEGARKSCADELAHVQSPETLTALKERYLSRKKGVAARFMARLQGIPAPEKPAAGQAINRGLAANILLNPLIELAAEHDPETYALAMDGLRGIADPDDADVGPRADQDRRSSSSVIALSDFGNQITSSRPSTTVVQICLYHYPIWSFRLWSGYLYI